MRILSAILDAGAGPMVREVDEEDRPPSPYFVAARAGHQAMVAALVQAGAPLEYKWMLGGTALTTAVEEGHIDVVVELLAAGADVDNINDSAVAEQRCVCTINFSDFTPLCIAASNVHEDILDILLLAGAVLGKDRVPPVPIHEAARDERCGCLQKLLTAGVNVNWVDDQGHSALHLACLKNQHDAVKCLLRHNADITLLTDEGLSPMDVVGLRLLGSGRSTLNATQTSTAENICQALKNASCWGRRGWLVMMRSHQLATVIHESPANDDPDCGVTLGGLAVVDGFSTGPTTSCEGRESSYVDVRTDTGWSDAVSWLVRCPDLGDVFRDIVLFL